MNTTLRHEGGRMVHFMATSIEMVSTSATDWN
jgi:hypothetical protein